MKVCFILQVSWLKRHGDTPHLLTFGLTTYSTDSRFQIFHEQPNDWKLQIQFPQLSDQGIYECLVSSNPPLVRRTRLTVIGKSFDISVDTYLSIEMFGVRVNLKLNSCQNLHSKRFHVMNCDFTGYLNFFKRQETLETSKNTVWSKLEKPSKKLLNSENHPKVDYLKIFWYCILEPEDFD